jgi:FkbM family methyltransferase
MHIPQESENSLDCQRSVHSIPLPNGLTFHLTSIEMLYSAKYVLNEIFVQQRYFRKGFEIRPGDTVVDIGANMGMFVLWAAPQADKGRVFAIDPAQLAFDCLQSNIRMNGLKNVTAIRAAVGKQGERMEMIEYPGLNIVSHQAPFVPPLITRLWMRYQKKQSIRTTAECVSLGGLMDEHEMDAINYLKIDCEGGEYEILLNLPPRYWERIERISLEFHELCPNQKHQELVSCLRKQGFQVQVCKPFFTHLFFKTGEIWAHR